VESCQKIGDVKTRRTDAGFRETRTMGAHLADSTAKDTGHVHATVFQARVAYVSQLATVCSLGLFSTIGEGRISLMAEVECLDLYTRRRLQRL